jgi:Cu/Ag efflux pump CusA
VVVRQLGLNGQDVKEVIPEVVGDEESGYAIQYGALTPVLIEAIKEQQKQIEELKELVNKLLNQK